MKKLKLANLKISSFNTSTNSQLKGGVDAWTGTVCETGDNCETNHYDCSGETDPTVNVGCWSVRYPCR